MSFKNNGPAGWAVHPGETLREEFLEPMNISPFKLALDLGVSPPTVNDIVREKRGITPGDGNSPGQVFRQLGAVLAQPAGRFCGVSRQKEILQGTQSHQDSGGGHRDPARGGQDGHSRSQDVELLQSVHPWADRTEPQFM